MQDIWLAPVEGDDVVRVAGRVTDRSFSGAFARMHFSAAGRDFECLLTGNGNTGLGLSDVKASWHARDMWIVRSREAGE